MIRQNYTTTQKSGCLTARFIAPKDSSHEFLILKDKIQLYTFALFYAMILPESPLRRSIGLQFREREFKWPNACFINGNTVPDFI